MSANTPPPPRPRGTAADFEAILGHIGFGKLHWCIMLSCGLMLTTVLSETLGMSVIVVSSQCDLHTTSNEKSAINFAAQLGIMLSSYYWGYLSDIHGRRRVLIFTTFSVNASSVVSALMPNVYLFIIFRFIVGIFLAASATVVIPYIAEFCTLKIRALVINFMCVFIGIGMIYVIVAAYVVFTNSSWCIGARNGYSFRPWRLLIMTYTLPSFIGALIMIQLPESPKFYMSVHEAAKAFATLEYLSRENRGQDLSDMGITELQEIKTRDHAMDKCLLVQMWLDTRPLFRQPYLCRFCCCCIIMFCVFFISNGLGAWFVLIRNEQQNISTKNATICEMLEDVGKLFNRGEAGKCVDIIQNYRDPFLLGCLYILGYGFLGLCLTYFDRKHIMIAGFLGSMLASINLEWMTREILIVMNFALLVMLPGVLISYVNVITGDLVPTYLRGKALCICAILGRAGAVLGNKTVEDLLPVSCSAILWLCTTLMFISILLAIRLPRYND